MLAFDETPVNEDDGHLNMYFHQGEEVVTVGITNRHSSYDPSEADEEAGELEGVDAIWNEDHLYEVAMSCARALGTMGKTKVLAALTRAVAEELEAALQ